METIPHAPVPRRAGVYGIIHTATSRIYIGSAIDITRRWYEHHYFLIHNAHCNEYLQNAWNKYGTEAFTWIVLEEVTDPSQLILLEQKWIDYYHAAQRETGFNLCSHAGSRLGVPRPEVAKLTGDEVRMIKARLSRGDSCPVIAEAFNVSKYTIKSIKNGRTWKHVTDFIPITGTPIRYVHDPSPQPLKHSRRRLLDLDDWYKMLESTLT